MNLRFAFLLFDGLVGTVTLSVLTFLFGGILGFAVALARLSPSRALATLAQIYMQLIQGIPLLVIMGLAYFGPLILDIGDVPPLVAATIAMTIFASSYLGEMWYGSLVSVAEAQWEAAECLGFSRWQRMTRIILPQALRIATPPTVGFMVIIIKNTSVSSLVVGYAELTYDAKILNNSTFQPFLFFGITGLIYFLTCYPLSLQARALERKLNVAHR